MALHALRKQSEDVAKKEMSKRKMCAELERFNPCILPSYWGLWALCDILRKLLIIVEQTKWSIEG